MSEITYEILSNLSPEKRKKLFDLQRVIIQVEQDLLNYLQKEKDREKCVEAYKQLEVLQKERSVLINQ